MVFYTLSITLIYSFYKPELVDSYAVANAFLPVIRKDYWYFTAYFLMFFLIPLFNAALNNLSRRQLRAVLLISVFLFTFIPCFARLKLWDGGISDLFWTSGGYNTCWLSLLYLVGGYVRLYSPFENVKNWFFALLFFASSILTLGVKLGVEKFLPFWKAAGLNSTLVNYTSPTIFLCGFCLLMIFCRLRISHGKKLIAFLSPLAFGVYLNHVNPLIWNDVIKGRWRSFGTLPVPQMVGMVLLTALVIYAICSLIDYLRLLIFKGLRIREGLVCLEKKLTRGLWDEEKKSE